MRSISDLLERIRKRPGVYIGNRSAKGLHLFIQGWLLGKGQVADSGVLLDFQQWVSSKYNIQSSHSWADIITFFSEGEVEAFETFFELLDEFLATEERLQLAKNVNAKAVESSKTEQPRELEQGASGEAQQHQRRPGRKEYK